MLITILTAALLGLILLHKAMRRMGRTSSSSSDVGCYNKNSKIPTPRPRAGDDVRAMPVFKSSALLTTKGAGYFSTRSRMKRRAACARGTLSRKVTCSNAGSSAVGGPNGVAAVHVARSGETSTMQRTSAFLRR